MSDNTKIEWADATWNPVVGCTRVSEGCMHCYAERFAARFPERFGGVSRMTEHGPRWTGKIVLRPEVLDQPLSWRKPRRIFVNSMSDLFHDDVPTWFIFEVFDVMYRAHWHTFQILTKRPERMREWMTWYYNESGIDREVYKNVWLGVSVENQRAADERIPLLLQTPAAVRFLSCEPLLGPVDLSSYLGDLYYCDNPRHGQLCPDGILRDGSAILCRYCKRPVDVFKMIDWVIVGGESGPGARPMHPDWVRGIRDQCVAAGVPFFFKQWGEWKLSWMAGEYQWMRVGKKAAGRLLDGRTWDELPVVVR